MRHVLITGNSGSGKSIALNVLEDDGFFCIDNLPVRFLDDVIGSLAEAGHERLAVAIDARSGDSVNGLKQSVGGLARQGHDIKILCPSARTDWRVPRSRETGRRLPLSLRVARDEEPPTLREAIEQVRELMSVLEDIGVSIDTSDLRPNVLRGGVRDVVGAERARITLLF